MQSSDIRQRYLKFFEKRGHKIIPSASLVPENDPSSLFITAGMQPLVPYLLGAKHPAGTRLVDVQKCIRTGDIEDVGDNRHLTFFEMLGNWSLGDYFKKESIEWSLEFLTNKEEGLGLDPKRLYITVFRGEDGIPPDEDSIKFWKENFKKHGMDVAVAGTDELIKDNVRIIPLGKEDNFWIAGLTGPCGGDTEIFYDVRPEEEKLEGKFSDFIKSGRIIEIWNNVFMEYNKQLKSDKLNEANEYFFRGEKIPEYFYEYIKLEKPNVDTGMGLERTAVVMQGKNNVFETDIFESILSEIKSLAKNYNEKSARIIADHIRAATFMIADGVTPSNTEQGYVLRRLLRRAVRSVSQIGLVQDIKTERSDLSYIAELFVRQNISAYPNLVIQSDKIFREIQIEEIKFKKTLVNGLKEFENYYQMYFGDKVTDVERRKILNSSPKIIAGHVAFKLFATHGFPIELTVEIAKEKGMLVDMEDFDIEMKKHQEISKAGSEQKFKGGLASHGMMETKYHTATHLLLRSLQEVLKSPIVQKGSNITAERLRFDFNWPEKVPTDKLKEVEDLVNEKIKEALPVEMVELPKAEAQKIATTLAFDLSTYPDMVTVYKIGVKNGEYFSIEFCGGPHVKNTSELGHFKIVKEEASSAGVRRIKAVLE